MILGSERVSAVSSRALTDVLSPSKDGAHSSMLPSWGSNAERTRIQIYVLGAKQSLPFPISLLPISWVSLKNTERQSVDRVETVECSISRLLNQKTAKRGKRPLMWGVSKPHTVSNIHRSWTDLLAARRTSNLYFQRILCWDCWTAGFLHHSRNLNKILIQFGLIWASCAHLVKKIITNQSEGQNTQIEGKREREETRREGRGRGELQTHLGDPNLIGTWLAV